MNAFFGGRSLHCHYPSKQSAVLLFSCHAQLFLIWIRITEGETLLCELSKAQENFTCCFMWVYNVVSHITWRTQAMEAEKKSWIKRLIFFLFPIYYYGDQIMQHTWPITDMHMGFLGVGTWRNMLENFGIDVSKSLRWHALAINSHHQAKLNIQVHG